MCFFLSPTQVSNVDLREFLSKDPEVQDAHPCTSYDLVANIVHDGELQLDCLSSFYQIKMGILILAKTTTTTFKSNGPANIKPSLFLSLSFYGESFFTLFTLFLVKHTKSLDTLFYVVTVT